MVAVKEINYSGLPEHCRAGMKRYIEEGIKPGNFLSAVLENDLMEALGRADVINRARIFDYALFLYNEAPRASYGSPKIVAAWIEANGARINTKLIDDDRR